MPVKKKSGKSKYVSAVFVRENDRVNFCKLILSYLAVLLCMFCLTLYQIRGQKEGSKESQEVKRRADEGIEAAGTA